MQDWLDKFGTVLEKDCGGCLLYVVKVKAQRQVMASNWDWIVDQAKKKMRILCINIPKNYMQILPRL